LFIHVYTTWINTITKQYSSIFKDLLLIQLYFHTKTCVSQIRIVPIIIWASSETHGRSHFEVRPTVGFWQCYLSHFVESIYSCNNTCISYSFISLNWRKIIIQLYEFIFLKQLCTDTKIRSVWNWIYISASHPYILSTANVYIFHPETFEIYLYSLYIFHFL
jgi:hypothetical protein